MNIREQRIMGTTDQQVDDNVSLIISIDVEEDMPDWKAQDQTTVKNIEGIPRLQDLFDEYGIKPTYLLTTPIAEDRDSVSVFSPILKNRPLRMILRTCM